MRIKCPYCGERGSEEFIYHGAAAPVRPRSTDGVSPHTWSTYVHERDNPAGDLQELWYHSAGCHSWLMVTRDTRTHEISAVQLAADVALERNRMLGEGA